MRLLNRYKRILKLFYDQILQHKVLLALIATFSVLEGLLIVYLANILGEISETIASQSYSTSLTILFISLLILKVVFQFLNSYYSIYGAKLISISLKTYFFKKIAFSPYENLLKFKSGDLMRRIMFELHYVQKFVIFESQIFIKNIFIVLLALINIIIISKSTFILMVVYGILMLLFNYGVWHKIIRSNRILNKISSQVYSRFLELVNGKSEIRIYRAENFLIGKSEILFNRILKQSKINGLLKAKNETVVEFISVLFILGIAYIIVSSGQGIKTNVTLVALMGILILPLKFINTFVTNFSKNASSMERLDELEKILGNPVNSSIKDIYQSDHTAIHLDRVSFGYDKTKPPILHDINLHFEAGFYLIQGHNGVGKSTLASLMANLINPDIGTITRHFSGSTTHLNLVVVRQDPFLFNGNLAYNISLDSGSDLQAILDLIKRYGLQNIMDVDLLLRSTTDNGFNLSGGQKQIVGLLRGLLHAPEILIIDELSNNLPRNIVEKILLNIKQDRQKLITILISHQDHDVDYSEVIQLN